MLTERSRWKASKMCHFIGSNIECFNPGHEAFLSLKSCEMWSTQSPGNVVACRNTLGLGDMAH
ncbi:hypothetical protein DMX78_00075 [Cutibacterium acnes]|uniref:Uncharacterized protein n=1 Tax=Cutibacterium acnes TaxID=1747 RepID=A0A2B7IYK1_CUTAC|nr:hypothetical protein CPA42_02945 [Cutibacterium acnes]EFS43903.1 hypothetical protein HMPREF9576_01138 [Cutibacterium acnes HL110PA2]EGF02341.1 hypothetical protein HMPREF9586_01294 [Cutibacterium acnes HL083PA2]PGF26614.1 hypothetical protein B1B06_04600 [Cutibacterium acnes subsp. acnes]PGF57449.1 hypothetical protein B1C79_12495 [Cutibacterium acnes subsp. defendens]QAZ48166.1 hypothetical protein cact_02955 [Cutibacterium acnes DSM 1897]QAZ50535.1 hypothetical protein cbac_02995 [Cutib